jgi:hypothetical protein
VARGLALEPAGLGIRRLDSGVQPAATSAHQARLRRATYRAAAGVVVGGEPLTGVAVVAVAAAVTTKAADFNRSGLGSA